MKKPILVTTSINDETVNLDVEPRWTLAEVLRDGYT